MHGRGWGWAAAGCALLALSAYLPWRANPYQFDDRLSILENPGLRSIRTALGTGNRKLTRISHAATLALWGQDPRGIHAGDLLLHLAASAAVGALACAVARRRPALACGWAPGAFGAAAFGVFLLHPLNSEAVLYMSARPDLLATLGGVGAAWAMLRASGGGARWVLAAGLLTAAAMLSKETGAMGWFCGILLASWARAESGRPARGWVLLGALSVAALAFETARYAGEMGLSPWRLVAGGEEPPRPYGEHLSVQARVHAWYLLPRVLLPARLCLSPGAPAFPPSWPGAAATGPLLLLALGALAVLGWRRGGILRLAALAWGWWFLAQAPTTLVNLPDPVFEHRSYLAMAGPCWLAAWAILRTARALARTGLAFAAPALLAAPAALWAARDHARGADFRSQQALWREVVRDAPAKPGARLNLGHAYQVESEDAPRGIRQYAKALPLAPPSLQAMIVNNIGNLQLAERRPAEAVRSFEIALSLSPGNPTARMNRAVALASIGRREEALREIEALASWRPQDGSYPRALGRIQMEAGNPGEAERWLRRAVAVDPDLADAWIDLGRLLAQGGRPAEAVEVLGRAAERCGHLARVWASLGCVRLQLGDDPGAEAAAARAARMDPGSVLGWATLAAVRSHRGDVDGAVAAYRAAEAASPGDPAIAPALRELEAVQRARRLQLPQR